MATFNYAGSAQTADRLLEKFGREIVLSRSADGNAASFDSAPAAVSTYKARAAVLPASKGTIQAFDNRLEGGTLIDEKLRFVIMSPKVTKTGGDGPTTIEPKSGDRLTFDGANWFVLGCTPLSPAGVAVYYGIGAKRV